MKHILTPLALTARSPLLRFVLPGLLLVTGAPGLLYEVVLGRFLALHLGSSGASQAVTLAAFLGGLSAGAIVAGRLCADRWHGARAPFLAYCGLEALIGVWAALFPVVSPLLFDAFDALAVGLAPGSAVSVATQLLLAAVLVLPMSTLMGATLPVLAAAVSRTVQTSAVPLIGRFYAVNALGGATGSLLAGFVLIERFGLEVPLWIGAAANFLVAGAAWSLAARFSGDSAAEEAVTVAQPSTDAPPYRAFLLAAAGTGMVTLVYEVVWVRLAGLLLGSSVYAFALMLTVVIVGISLGSALATWAVGRGADPRRVFGWTQAAAALMAFFLYMRLGALPLDLLHLRLPIAPSYANYPGWIALGGGTLALHFLPAAMALGASFPVLLDGARMSGGSVARATSLILGSNTIGNLLGAMLGGFVLMPILGVEKVLLVGAWVSLALSLLCLPRPLKPRNYGVSAAIAALIPALAMIAPPDITMLHRGLFRVRNSRVRPVEQALAYIGAGKQVFREDGKDASISVDYRADDGLLLFRTNGKTDGSNFEPVTQVGLGHVGFLARPDAKSVFVVGLGTGQSAASAASHPGVKVQVAELSPAVVEVAKLFAPYNGDVVNNAAVQILVADAREALKKSPAATFDVVISEPSNPWVVGVADLYTEQAFSLMKSRMKPGGVLVQWIQVYEMSDAVFRSILCTLKTVFPHAVLFRLEAADIAVVAAAEPFVIDPARARELIEHPQVQRSIEGAQHRRLPRTADDFPVLQMSDQRTTDSICKGFTRPMQDVRPSIEYAAPRDFFAGVAPTRLIRALDSRLTSQGQTALAQQLRQGSTDPARRARLHAYLAKSPGTHEAPLQMASRPPDERERIASSVAVALPDPATAVDAELPRWCSVLARRAPWAVHTLDTMFGPVTTNEKLRAWHKRCRSGLR